MPAVEGGLLTTAVENDAEPRAIPPSGILIYFDKERFRSVLENLFLNALESGSKSDDIRAEIKENDGRVRIEVLDRGKGVENETLPRMFDPFFTTKSRGTGVGLSVIKRFVEAAGGTVFMFNREGGGAAAGFELPRYNQ
jgi:signal transduction histidine kinase